MNPRPSPSPKHGKMPIRVTALSFDLCVLYPIVPSPVKNRGKRVTASILITKGVGPSTTLAWPGWKQPEIAVEVHGHGTTQNEPVQQILCKLCITLIP